MKLNAAGSHGSGWRAPIAAAVLLASCQANIEGSAQPSGEPLPDRQDASAVQLGPADCHPPAQRWWKLTPDQVARSLSALGGPIEGVADRLKPFEPGKVLFSNRADQLAWSANYYAEIFKLSHDVADAWVKLPDKLAPCLAATAPPDASCLTNFVGAFGARAFRRPLSGAEVSDFVAFHATEAAQFGAPAALSALVQRLLGSPEFLHRAEFGSIVSGQIRLTPHELASELSYFLLDGPPDQALQHSAETGALRDPSALREQATRLLASPDLSPGLLKLFDEYLQVDAVSTRQPDIPNREQVLRSMREEPGRFVREVLWNDDHRLSTLLSAPYGLVDGALAEHYGLAMRPQDWQRVTLPDRPGGLLAQASLLTARRTASPRGRYLRERLLCQPTPEPPTNVDTNLETQKKNLEAGGQTLTPRQVRERHIADAACSSCHSLMDPLGFPFDVYDAAGRYQPTLPDGSAIPTEGTISGTAKSDGAFANVGELVARLAQSSEVNQCFVQHVFEYAYGRPIEDGDRCYLDQLVEHFNQSGGDVRALIVDLVGLDNFSTRSPMRND